MFIWRLCCDNLPTRLNLFHKKIEVPITCVMRRVDVEHIWHTCLDCPFARSCWVEAGIHVVSREDESVGEWCLRMLSLYDPCISC